MKLLWRWLRWALYALGGLLGLVVALQLFYALLPEPALNAEAQRMQEAAAPHFVANDAGYFALGLLAPEGMDPIAYGKCRAMALQAQQREIDALPKTKRESRENAMKPVWDHHAEREKACLQGQPKLEIKRVLIKGELEWKDVIALAEQGRIPATYESRAKQLTTLGVLGFDPSISMVVLGSRDLTALSDLASFYSADGALRWERGDQSGALVMFEQAAMYAKSLHNSSLLDLMIANAIHARQLRIIQLLVARAPTLTAEDARQLTVIVATADALPAALAPALAYEHSMSQQIFGRTAFEPPNITSSQEEWERKLMSKNRAANRHASALRSILDQTQTASAALAFSKASGSKTSQSLCANVGEIKLPCMLLFPDPFGYLYTQISTIGYADYPVRLHQTAMLANAARLTIAAREKNLQGDALLQFAKSAPPNMRDSFTNAPFELDAKARTLTIPAYVKNTATTGKYATQTLPM
jgi:hypothetical protein